MADSERMVALKKAYAEIILNTAKAAAERVVESERKARGLQQNLVTSKQESVRLLLRLKHMIQAKESELLRATSSQKSKIDLLESQLQEAENVIIDLREELRGLRRELEKAKKSRDQPQRDTNMEENEFSRKNAVSETIMPMPSKSEVQTVISRRGNDQSAPTEDMLMSEGSSIRDLERLKNFSSNINEESKSKFSSFMNTDAERLKNFSSQEEIHANIQILGEKSTPFGNLKPMWKSHHIQPAKSYQAPAILSRRKLFMGSGNSKSPECSFDTKKSCRETEEPLSKNDLSVSGQMIVQEVKRQKKMQRVDAASSSFIFNPDPLSKVCHPSFYPTRCSSYSFLLHGNGNSSENSSKVKETVNLRLLPRLDPGLTLIRGGDSITSSENVKMLNESCILQNTAERNGEQREVKSVAAIQNSSDQLDESNQRIAVVPVEYAGLKCNGASKEISVGVSAECCESEGAELHTECDIFGPSEGENNRSIKYTFHRRHKKEALSRIDENISWDNNNVGISLGEKEKSSVGVQKKSSLLNESNKGKLRPAQVARQVSIFPAAVCIFTIALSYWRKWCP